MAAAGREGVIKFQLDYREGPAPKTGLVSELNTWRSIFLDKQLIGQDPRRYEGLSFGNLSRRLGPGGDAFLITGTQTGHLSKLSAEDYSTVLACDPERNRLTATGCIKPSSEALSHGVLYQSGPTINWVMHLHSPQIFDACARLQLPYTAPGVTYGTPEMAREIKRIAESMGSGRAGLMVMAGHQDGILAFGPTADSTGQLVLSTLQRAEQPAV